MSADIRAEVTKELLYEALLAIQQLLVRCGDELHEINEILGRINARPALGS